MHANQLLWRGLEAFEAAAELLQAAEAAVAADAAAAAAAGVRQPFVWRHGMLRPARSAKQAADVARFVAADAAGAAAVQAEVISDAAALAALVPGLQPQLLTAPDKPAAAQPAAAQRRKRPQGAQQHAVNTPPPALGLLVRAGSTIHPASYMAALWLACQQAAAAAGGGSVATLHVQRVPSLQQLHGTGGPFDAVVVAAGAAVDSIAELQGRLPLDLCHGYSLDMRPPGWGGSGSSGGGQSGDSGCSSGSGSGSSFPAGAPSLLGSPYIAAHGSSSAVVGATKRFGLTPAEAFAQLSRPVVHDVAEAEAAADALLPAASSLWPPISGWRVEAVRAGVRALPVRGADGAIPYAGRLPAPDETRVWALASSRQPPSDSEASDAEAAAASPPAWVIGGLGARGLVYHAWLGRLVAAAVLAGSEAGLPPELLRWKQA